MVFTAFTRCLEFESSRGLRLQLKEKFHFVGADCFGRRLTGDSGAPRNSIQSLVCEGDTVWSGFSLEVAPSFPAVRAADLENIGEVGSEGDAQRNIEYVHSVVDQLQFLVGGLTP